MGLFDSFLKKKPVSPLPEQSLGKKIMAAISLPKETITGTMPTKTPKFGKVANDLYNVRDEKTGQEKFVDEKIWNRKYAPTYAPKKPTPTLATRMMNQPVSVDIPSNVDQRNIDYLEQNVLPLTRKLKIHDAVAAGIWAGEGRYGGTGVGNNNNNWWNLMTNGKTVKYPSNDVATNDFYLTLKNLSQQNGGKYEDMTPEQILTEIQKGPQKYEGSRKDYPSYVMSTPEYKRYYKKK